MKTYRIMAVVCLILILANTAAMIAALAKGDSQMYFILGGVLVAVVITSWVLVKTFKEKYRKEAEDDGAPEN